MWKPVPYCLAFMGLISTYHTTKKKNNHLSNQSVNTANYNDFPEKICLLEQVPWKYPTIFGLNLIFVALVGINTKC